ncbi:MAG: T9SS type A sorting domain-containing protein [Ignavibacteriota bacterium]|nr:MAG: T9SS C-terminal target domain-containing protein [Chlorobiota bacterium]MBE7475146.1 T9SS type A sorting domain-containing protein [Ignavibacteriales bacterium]MBL1122513.1 T9SS C-terminal target domain-containing protein [Ignavibacteriota bacterium]MCE7857116.1 T9SS C-terminal target domain-containing protein [Ignavibacteria bacterium CHB3]NUM63267.1 T9SS type A sorting domain-containing protein [Ignavibacteriaceae bacterium]
MMIDFNMEMPAELISFNATSLDNNVTLDWSTATETNNSGFEINRKKLEARSQELEWEMIGFVPGFGTTTEPKSYSFIDENVTNGIYKYRLKQIDFDGSFEYLPIGQAGSNEIEVEVDFTPKEFVLYQNYPNPFNPNTVIRFEIPGQARNDNVLVTLKIYDILGNEVATLVNEEKQAGVYEVEFDASSLASGMYLYKLQAGGFVQTKKMILLR